MFKTENISYSDFELFFMNFDAFRKKNISDFYFQQQLRFLNETLRWLPLKNLLP